MSPLGISDQDWDDICSFYEIFSPEEIDEIERQLMKEMKDAKGIELPPIPR